MAEDTIKADGLHQEAMRLADEALMARLKGNRERERKLLFEAYQAEREAAARVAGNRELEPTRSVLHRSAASFAIECEEYREAERLIATALTGNPPAQILEELRDLLEQVYFQRHLATRGVSLEPDEVQVSLAGDSIGFGVVHSKQFVRRIEDIEMLVYRTAERTLNKPFRESGRRKEKLKREVEMYLSVPRAASFAVTLRLGSAGQLDLEGMGVAQHVIDELLACFQLFEERKTDALKQRIDKPEYYRNFFGLAKRIAPDGKKVRTVGFTAVRHGRQRRVSLSTPRDRIEVPEEEPKPEVEQVQESVVRGQLKYADDRTAGESEIRLIDDKGTAHRVHVPEGMMRDIVKPLWDDEVIVEGPKVEGIIRMERIDSVEE